MAGVTVIPGPNAPTAPAAAPPDIAALIAQVEAAMAHVNATNLSAHGPYEDLGIKALDVLLEIIKGQTPDQKAKCWQNWIDFFQPLIDAGKGLSAALASLGGGK